MLLSLRAPIVVLVCTYPSGCCAAAIASSAAATRSARCGASGWATTADSSHLYRSPSMNGAAWCSPSAHPAATRKFSTAWATSLSNISSPIEGMVTSRVRCRSRPSGPVGASVTDPAGTEVITADRLAAVSVSIGGVSLSASRAGLRVSGQGTAGPGLRSGAVAGAAEADVLEQVVMAHLPALEYHVGTVVDMAGSAGAAEHHVPPRLAGDRQAGHT